MAHPEQQTGAQKIFTLLLLVVSVAILYLAAEVLMPLALAILLTFILAPLVNRLERLHFGRVPSVLVAVGCAFAVLFSIGWIVAGQMVDLASELPQYRENIVAKIRLLKRTETGPLSRVEKTIKELSSEIAQPMPQDNAGANDAAAEPGNADPQDPQASEAQAAAEAEDDEPKPVPVEIVEPGITPYSVLSEVVPGAFGWLATAGIVIVFLIFMLLEREDMRNRLIQLIGPDQITVTTQALDDAGRRVSRYLRMQLIINASYGLMLAIGLYFIGLPNAVTWGLFAGLLRYLPYVGPWLGATVGILLSLAVFDGWTSPLLTMALFLTAELIVNNLLEPVLYRSSTGISATGIIVAAAFWTWLWGPFGLVLSTPLTVCIAVIGRYVPNLEFLNVLLTDEPPLPPGAHLYQRLLVSDEEEARELVEEYLHDSPLDALFENVLLPALILTEQDGHRGVLDDARREYILENLRDLLEELPELKPNETASPAPEEASAVVGSVVIVPARDLADEIAGLILQVRLRMRQVPATVLPPQMLLGEILEKITSAPAPIVVISAVPPFATRHARHLAKRLRHRLPGTKILAVVWAETQRRHRTDERLRAAGIDRVFSQLAQLLEHVELLRKSRQPEASSGEPAPAETLPGTNR